MSLLIRTETVGLATCDRCQESKEIRVESRVSASSIIEKMEPWRIRRHRKAATEVVCIECIGRELAGKEARRDALARIAAEKKAAIEKARAERAALLKPANAVPAPEVEA